MSSPDQIREAIEETPGNARLGLTLHSGEQLFCSCRRRLEGDSVTVWVEGKKRTVELDQVASVGQVLVNRARHRPHRSAHGVGVGVMGLSAPGRSSALSPA